jgi:hypothetical protein
MGIEQTVFPALLLGKLVITLCATKTYDQGYFCDGMPFQKFFSEAWKPE